ncbi:class E sortase [Luteimicrobium album]|uniref:class E sortase n=1 Tax=Luteimicrobium album TaxID=1054550 RepID=UPI0024E132C9|nr:class E sortase [Luteimicrobium album]
MAETSALERPQVEEPARQRAGALSVTLGVLGELLITAGILVGLFLVWQLWWTSVPAERHAAQQVQAFYAQVEPANPKPVDKNALHTDHVPVVKAVPYGQMIGVLIVPSWQGKTRNRMPIAEGTTLDVLNKAYAGHYTDTAQVGQIGNFSIAGHRRTYGNNFFHLPDLRKGDSVVVETDDYWFVYQVTGHEQVLPDQTDVVAPVPGDPGATPTERLITLTTCNSVRLGAYGNDHRWIVHGTLEGWLKRSEGTPKVVSAMKG